MNPLLKKGLAAVALKQAYDKVQERRHPKKPSLLSRVTPLAMVGALGGALFYLSKSGKLGPMVNQIRGKSESTGTSDWQATSAVTDAASATSAPSPTTETTGT